MTARSLGFSSDGLILGAKPLLPTQTSHTDRHGGLSPLKPPGGGASPLPEEGGKKRAVPRRSSETPRDKEGEALGPGGAPPSAAAGDRCAPPPRHAARLSPCSPQTPARAPSPLGGRARAPRPRPRPRPAPPPALTCGKRWASLCRIGSGSGRRNRTAPSFLRRSPASGRRALGRR